MIATIAATLSRKMRPFSAVLPKKNRKHSVADVPDFFTTPPVNPDFSRLTISLQHRRFISSLCMLYKIFHNPSHPLHSELPNLFHPRRVTRGSLSINSLSFSPMRFHTSQYSRCFIPATTKLWNELPSMIVEATELQKFKIGANAFLLGVDGL